ncbi:hypothetical protein [Acidocella sp.]|uniref:hypothetical protein n=1 Tax=Acidocella sp. TaxID=50710 RepID=UPI003CFEC14A
MGSPFKTADQFLNATGPLHSFAGHPDTIAVFTVLAVALTVYALVKAFTIHH